MYNLAMSVVRVTGGTTAENCTSHEPTAAVGRVRCHHPRTAGRTDRARPGPHPRDPCRPRRHSPYPRGTHVGPLHAHTRSSQTYTERNTIAAARTHTHK